MMSDLAEIAAAAGITIIDEDDIDEKGDMEAEKLYEAKGPVSDDLAEMEQIHNWDVLFADRYTMSDPDYASTVEAGDVGKHQPCVTGFSCFRQRDDRRNWDRDRRGNRGRGNSHGGWNRNSGDNSSWNRGERSHYQPQSYGDHHDRGYGSQYNRSESSNDRRSWGNNNDQGRTYGHYQSRGGHESYQSRGNYQSRQEQHSQHSRNDAGDRRNRYENQGNKDSNKGSHRDRSPQR